MVRRSWRPPATSRRIKQIDLLYCRNANWCRKVPISLGPGVEVGEGVERFRAPIAIMACRIEGEVSQAWSMRRVQRSLVKRVESWREVWVQKCWK